MFNTNTSKAGTFVHELFHATLSSSHDAGFHSPVDIMIPGMMDRAECNKYNDESCKVTFDEAASSLFSYLCTQGGLYDYLYGSKSSLK